MATHWVKQSRSERMSTATNNAQPMSFISGTFTHALATLAIDQRTEREKVALVEALLLSRRAGNRKKAEAKLIEFNTLRHKIVRDQWNKAIHQVIIQYNIPDRIRANKSRAEGQQQPPIQKQPQQQQPQHQQLKSSLRQHRKTDAQVRFNLGQGNRGQAMTEVGTEGSMPPRPPQSLRPAGSLAAAGQASQYHQQHISSQPWMMPHFQNQVAPTSTFQAFNHSIGVQPLSSMPAGPGPAAWSGNTMTLPATTANYQADTIQPFGRSTASPDPQRAASYGTVSKRSPSSQQFCGPFPSVPSQQLSSVATGHGSHLPWMTASLSSCPTESSEASSKHATVQPPPARQAAAAAVPRASLSSCATEPSQVSSLHAPTRPPPARTIARTKGDALSHPPEASARSLKAPASPSAARRKAAALSSGPPSVPDWRIAPVQMATPSCTTEWSSEAGKHRMSLDAPLHAPASQSRRQPYGDGRPFNVPMRSWSHRRSAAASSVADGSEVTESSVSGSHVQAHLHHGDSLQVHSENSSRMQGRRPAGSTQWALGHPSARLGHSSVVPTISSAQQAPGSQGTWGGMQQPWGNMAVCTNGKAQVARTGSAMCTAKSLGGPGSCSTGSHRTESTSRRSAGSPVVDDSLLSSSQRIAVRNAPGAWEGAGNGMHAAGGVGPWRGQGVSPASERVHALRADSIVQRAVQRADTLVHGVGLGGGLSASDRQLQGRAAVTDRFENRGGAGRGESQGSETTESSEDEGE